MKFTQVTWYSKLGALLLIIILPIVGFYLGMQYQKATTAASSSTITNLATESAKKDSDKKVDDSDNVQIDDGKTIVETSQMTVKTSYEDGVLKYAGTIQFANSCQSIKDETKVLESFPEQVQIRMITFAAQTETPCAMLAVVKEFSGSVQVSKKAIVSVFLNGEKVK